MTTEMFIGGLMILTAAAVVVVTMTSSNSSFFERLKFDRKSGQRDRNEKDT